MVQLTDSSIIKALQEGDGVVFEQVFKLHYEGLCRYGATLLKDGDGAEEVVQQIFCRIWEKQKELEIEKSVRVYLYRSVHNACLNVLKHQKIRRKYQQVQEKTGIREFFDEDKAATGELQQKIAEAIDALPPQCGLIFKMSRWEDKKYATIAAELAISVKTVENQMGKALAILRSSLTDYLGIYWIFFLLNGEINNLF
jgi:RNA polymerase sigma-70 factor, ECF subfamily